MSYNMEISDSIFVKNPLRINPITTGTKPSATRFWRKQK